MTRTGARLTQAERTMRAIPAPAQPEPLDPARVDEAIQALSDCIARGGHDGYTAQEMRDKLGADVYAELFGSIVVDGGKAQRERERLVRLELFRPDADVSDELRARGRNARAKGYQYYDPARDVFYVRWGVDFADLSATCDGRV